MVEAFSGSIEVLRPQSNQTTGFNRTPEKAPEQAAPDAKSLGWTLRLNHRRGLFATGRVGAPTSMEMPALRPPREWSLLLWQPIRPLAR